MLEIKHVLCPVDFSDSSRHALDHASAVANWYGAPLSILHVIPNLLSLELAYTSADPRENERVKAHLEHFTAHIPRTVPVELCIQEAPDIHREIIAQANSRPGALLVMGSHGRSGINRLLLGSITEKVMRSAPGPVLIVPPHAGDRAPNGPVRFDRILCPIDFSDSSLVALEHAIALAEESDARLTLLHVIEVRPELSEFPISATLEADRLREAAERDAFRRLEALVPEQAQTYCTIETAVYEGTPFRSIIKRATETRADLIVMGVQGRSAIDLVVFGSNTERVARQSHCPLLIVRHDHAPGASSAKEIETPVQVEAGHGH